MLIGESNSKAPHHTTIRNWVHVKGFHELYRPLEQAADWIAIGDLTIEIGKVKCLAIVGVRASKLELREDCTLSHNDVSILGLYPTEKATAEFCQKSFKHARERVGSDFLAIVTDQGPEIKKGVKLFMQEYPTKHLFDIPHKLSLTMKRRLENNPVWKNFIGKLAETKKLIQQTDLAALIPPTQRSKGRFMDIEYLIRWPRRILELYEKGDLAFITEDQYQKYFGWISTFELALREWEFMVGVVDLIKETVRKHGLSKDVYEYLKLILEELPEVEEKHLQLFVSEGLTAVREEYEKLQEGEELICSTEVLESIFGKLKEIVLSKQGISGNVLSMGTFVSEKSSEEGVKKIMETWTIKSATSWIKGVTGKTIGAMRHQFNMRFKRTKFDSEMAVQNAC